MCKFIGINFRYFIKISEIEVTLSYEIVHSAIYHRALEFKLFYRLENINIIRNFANNK